MNVIDVTPDPGYVEVVRFLQSRLMSFLGILFLLTALKWGTLLFAVPQHETGSSLVSGKLCARLRIPG